eukprot:TRINITY_DN113525_c0_g1_i1.p1 TRINITY_DN113525_c0_g1~~TRINITY_DN113525_c0_g1_i1.p1  ORF type:complete len:213 (+),score=22.97 TRINITY_DN113525_c0_g1_i1:82-639(+)
MELKGWLDDSGSLNMAASRIPPAASSIQGVNFFPIDKNNRTILVKEKSRFGGKLKPVSGGVDLGEDVVQAALRELKEETGVEISVKELQLKSLRLLGGWERANARPGNIGDCMYYLAVKINRAFSEEELIPDGVEIAEVVLMNVDGVVSSPQSLFFQGVQSMLRCWKDGFGTPATYNPATQRLSF